MRTLILLFSLIFFSCGEIRSFRSIPMGWKNISSRFEELPEGIRVFEGRNKQLPINAWYVIIDGKNPHLNTDIVVSNDNDGRESPSQFAERLNANIVVNGGYFLMHKNPTEHVGLLKDNDVIISNTLRSTLKREKRYYLTRSALGFDNSGQMDIAWIASHNDSIFEWMNPALNKPDHPVTELNYKMGTYWNMYDAMQAGPVIVSNGRKNVTDVEEVFFWSKIPDVHPRTAAGYTKNREYILLVVDGRQPDSRGVDLDELSILMYDLNCVEAINLDGGGSSSMVVNGTLLNKPAGFSTQREVISAIAVYTD